MKKLITWIKSVINKLKPRRNLNYLNSLDLVSAYAWSKMQEENDYNWLRDGFDGRQKRIKDISLEQIRKDLEDKAFLLMDDDNFNTILSKRMEIYKYAEKYELVKTILQRMWMGFGDMQMENRLVFIQKLKLLGFKMSELNSVEGDRIELERLFSQVEGIKTKINLLIDDIKVEGSKVTRSLNKDIINVCKIVECEMQDAKKISQAFWIELQKTAHEINEKRRLKEQ